MIEVQRVRIPGVADEDLATINRLLAQLHEKLPRNLLRASYYDGKRAIRQVGSVIPPNYYRMGLVLGWAAKSVDILAQRVNLEGFAWPDGDLDDLGASEIWTANRFGSEINAAFTSSLIHAVAFRIVTKGGPGEPAALIHTKDATSATGDWNRRTRRLDSLLSVNEWADTPGDGGLPEPVDFSLYLPGRTLTAVKENGQWSTDWRDHPFHVPAEPLVFKPRTGRDMGASRMSRPVLSLQDQALRTVIRMEGHMDVYSFPELWMLGADESIFKTSDGALKPSWQVMLGRIKGIPDDESATTPRADVKSIPAASPEPHLAALKQQAQLFSGETSIPLTSLGVSDMSNPTSADSYIASREDLIALAETAADDWAPALAREHALALAIANDLSEIPAEWSSIVPQWRSPAHLSRTAAADAGSKQIAAVPWLAETEVGLELLGLDQQQAKRALADRRRAQGVTALRERLAANAGAVVDPTVADLASRGAMDPGELKKAVEVFGGMIRSGVEPADAARLAGLDGVRFTGAVPVSLRVPESDASKLETKD